MKSPAIIIMWHMSHVYMITTRLRRYMAPSQARNNAPIWLVLKNPNLNKYTVMHAHC